MVTAPLPGRTSSVAPAHTNTPSFVTPPWVRPRLAPGAPVAPARVLSGQPRDQSNHVAGTRRAPASRLDLCPFAGHQPAVPPQDRVRGHQEARPAHARKRGAEYRQKRTVGGSELGSLD